MIGMLHMSTLQSSFGLSLYTPKQQAIPSHLIVVEYSADNGLVRASVIRLPFSDGEEGG